MTEECQNDDVFAAEFVIGLLSSNDHLTARRRMSSDPDFSALVGQWQARLAHMADLEALEPPKGAKNAIMKRLFPDLRPVSIWDRVGLWKGLAAGALAGLLMLSVWVWQMAPDNQQGPLYTAEIVSDTGDFRVIAVVDRPENEVVLIRTAGAAPDGRVLQVWTHGPDEPAQSVGLWQSGQSIRLPLPTDIATVQGTLTLGVSEEPPGGSATGSPTGRVFGTVDIVGYGN